MFEHEQQDVIDLHQLFWCLVTVRSLYELLSWYQRAHKTRACKEIALLQDNKLFMRNCKRVYKQGAPGHTGITLLTPAPQHVSEDIASAVHQHVAVLADADPYFARPWPCVLPLHLLHNSVALFVGWLPCWMRQLHVYCCMAQTETMHM